MNIIVFFGSTVLFYGIYVFGIANTRYDGLQNEAINLSMIATAFVLSGLCLRTNKQKSINRGAV